MLCRLINIVSIFCVIVTVLMVSGVAHGAVLVSGSNGREVDVRIYFECDESQIDPTYMNNGESLRLVDSLLRDTLYLSTLRRIEITAQSSPDGRVEYNQRLAEQRRLSLETYFSANSSDVDPRLWSFNAVAENWDLFQKHLSDDLDLPRRDEVLSIARGDRELDDKEWLIKTLDGGKPWRYIKENILPLQRFGASMLFIPMLHTLYAPLAQPTAFEGGYAVEPPVLPSPSLSPSPSPVMSSPRSLFALNSNLLLDLLSVINIAAEVPIGRRWSVVAEVAYPWWRSWSKNVTMQIESYHAELKYWLGDRSAREQLQGWSVGAYGGWGRYDVQPFSDTGVQGSFSDVGAQVGFAHPIARNLHLEYTLGLGYLSTDYEDYKMVSDTEEYGDIKVIPYPWTLNSLKSIFPTRCGVSLVWVIKSKGGRRR